MDGIRGCVGRKVDYVMTKNDLFCAVDVVSYDAVTLKIRYGKHIARRRHGCGNGGKGVFQWCVRQCGVKNRMDWILWMLICE